MSNNKTSLKMSSAIDDNEIQEHTYVQDLSISQRPLTLVTDSIDPYLHSSHQRYNIDNIDNNLSPMDLRPRIFHPGLLFNSTIHQEISLTTTEQMRDESLFNEQMFTDQRLIEINELNKVIQSTQPENDEEAQAIMAHLNMVLQTTIMSTNDVDDDDEDDSNERQNDISTMMISTHSYPPANQQGPIAHYDRPYADYGHLDCKTIAEECQFILYCKKPQDCHTPRGPVRFPTKSFAITCWTTVSKEAVMEEIKRQFPIQNIQYACVAQEIGDVNGLLHLHIQIILKSKTNKKIWFLDDITGTHCNYQVTDNDLAWNEYIKKGLNFIEFGSFKSVHTRGEKNWPTQTTISISSRHSVAPIAVPPPPTTTTTTTMTTINTTVRGKAEQRRKHLNETAKKAIELAKISVDSAMDFIIKDRPNDFIQHCTWYLNAFKYINLRAQEQADKVGLIEKEYQWPQSFPHCTPDLRKAIDEWLKNEFTRSKRAKCLVLIGPSGTGKTTFAKSLTGRFNYFQQSWNVDHWSDYARYSIYDDIPWDDFEKRHFPSKKSLLTQNGPIHVTGKYRAMKTIHVTQPAIVLLNKHDTGSLLTQPKTENEQDLVDYWKERAYVYIMGPHESFFKKTIQDQTNIINELDETSSVMLDARE